MKSFHWKRVRRLANDWILRVRIEFSSLIFLILVWLCFVAFLFSLPFQISIGHAWCRSGVWRTVWTRSSQCAQLAWWSSFPTRYVTDPLSNRASSQIACLTSFNASFQTSHLSGSAQSTRIWCWVKGKSFLVFYWIRRCSPKWFTVKVNLNQSCEIGRELRQRAGQRIRKIPLSHWLSHQRSTRLTIRTHSPTNSRTNRRSPIAEKAQD